MKRLAVLLLLLFALTSPQPASTQFNGCLPGFCSGGSFSSSCAEATAFLARTSGLNLAHKTDYNTLICGLVTDGVWAKLDVLHIYATADSTTALLNLVSTSYNGTLSGTPAFVTDRGFVGDAVSHIDTGFNPTTAGSPKFVQNSAHVSIWSLNDPGGGAEGVIGVDSSTGETDIYPHYNTGNTFLRINSTAIAGAAFTSALGLLVANRSTNLAVQGYLNTSQIVTNNAATSTAPLNHSIPTMAIYHLDTAFYGNATYNLAEASIGSSLSSTDETNFYNRLRTYMTAKGIP